MQTSSFRGWLNSEITSLVAEETNGNLSIGRIEGTVLTSIFFHNVSLSIESDTLFSATRIGVKTNPLELLLGKIYIRDILINDAEINLLDDNQNRSPLDKLPRKIDTGPDIVHIEQESPEFPFLIYVNNFSVSNLRMKKQAFRYLNSKNIYNTMEIDDLSVDSLYLTAKLAVDLNQNHFRLLIENLSAKPNLRNFQLNKLSGSFEISEKFAEVTDLKINAQNLNLDISARLDSINLFAPIDLEDFKNYPVRIDFSTKPFNFDALTSFIDATDILKGELDLELQAKGKFGDFGINKLSAIFSNTSINMNGRMRNLHTPGNMYIDANIFNSYADYQDVMLLLPSLPIPQYENLILTNFNVEYSGEPTKFNAIGSSDINKGSIIFDTFLDVSVPVMEYDIKMETKNVDVFQLINTHSNLNSKMKISGVGTNTTDLHTEFVCEISKSRFDNYSIESLKCTSQANENIVSIDCDAKINNSPILVNGRFDFNDQKNPLYDLTGSLKNFNIDEFFEGAEMPSDLDFRFTANGKYLDLDKTIGEFHVNLDSSTIRNKPVNGESINLSLDKTNGQRIINLDSDFLDFYANGDFNISELIDLLDYQYSITTEIFKEKINSFAPIVDTTEVLRKIPDVVNRKIALDFDFDFKDFSIFQTILDNDTLDIAGQGSGFISNNDSLFEISTELDLEQLVTVDRQDVVYMSGLNIDINFSRDNSSLYFDNILGALTLSGERIYTGSNLQNVSLDILLNDKKVIYFGSAKLSEDLSTEFAGDMDIRENSETLNIDLLKLNYKNILWKNREPLVIKSINDSLFLKNLTLTSDKAAINIDGFFGADTQIVDCNFRNLEGPILESFLSESTTDSLFLNLYGNCEITGNFENPIIKLDMNIDTLAIAKVLFGSFKGILNYSDEIINTEVIFSSLNEEKNNLLTILGTTPINLSFTDVPERIIKNEQISLDVKASDFNISAFGSLLPFVDKQRGFINADMKIGGNLDDIIIAGNLSLNRGYFKVRSTNLNYTLDFNMQMENEILSLTEFNLSNSWGAKYNGELTGSGKINFGTNGLEKIELVMNGNITLLGYATRDINPYIYGDLFLGSNGDWKFVYNNSKVYFDGDIDVLYTDLIYTSPTGGFNESSEEFIYSIKIDSSRTNLNELDFEKLIESVEDKNGNTESPTKFEYNVKINTIEDAKFTVHMNKAINQKLILYIRGNMAVENFNDQVNTQGSLRLLDGSRLEFFKNFAATGDVKFEKDLTDPYLDIIASYVGDYVSSLDPFQQSQEVAVKLRLRGTLSEIGQSLVLDPENFAVYSGRRDIEANSPDLRYDASDALTFIFFGKFKEDLTAANKAELAGQTTTTNTTGLVLGPVLSSFLNSTIGGGLIEDIQISQTGQYTRLGISGKYENLRYRIGGTTEALSDISKANILIQYFFTNDLSLRLERRYPIIYSEGTADRVDELGLRYRFEF